MGWCRLYKVTVDPDEEPDCGVVLVEFIEDPGHCSDCDYYEDD